QARLLTLQTAFGAAKLALESSDDLTTLRQNVTSKGGTTAAALQHLQQGGLESLFDGALKAAHARSIELGKILGEQ
ncbi:MAG: pyrroline-5-carboxylate reductase dimerization domain-containing protein, partial [Gammaproteobacteria bacterium]|nr:pyrroline-5-carboxylate reductase dimerization domain-containing protein [Gammaproteobacteria bacterium]